MRFQKFTSVDGASEKLEKIDLKGIRTHDPAVLEQCFNPLNPKIKLLPLFISYRSSGQKLVKYQANSSCVIMSVILMTTLFYYSLTLQGEICCWLLLRLKGLTNWAIKPNLREEKDMHFQAKPYVSFSFSNKTSLLGYLYSGDTIVQVTHCSPAPPKASSYNLFISYLYWMDTSIQGTAVLVLSLSLEWRIHCIMFVSVTSVEGTPPFRGHLAWSWGYPPNGGSNV